MGLLRTSLLVVLSCSVMSAQAANFNQKKIKVNEPSFSSYFYSDSVGPLGCAKSREWFVSDIEQVIGYDWSKDHKENSNSLNVTHQGISAPVKKLFALSHTAVASKNEELIGQAKRLTLAIAKDNTLADSMTLSEVKKIGKRCYDGKGNIEAECNFHEPQFVMQFVGNYMISTSLIWPHLSKSERDTVIDYSDKMYKAYVRPIFDSLRKGKTDFSQMANGGIAVLAYAYLKNDSRLAQQTFNQIFQNINKVFLDDGYIKGSSFRGVRGFFYHSLGTNSALAVLHLAKQWNVNIPEETLKKVTASAKLINVGIADLRKFESRKSPTGKQYNASYDPKDAYPHVYTEAIGMNELSQSAVNVFLNTAQDAIYARKSKAHQTSDFMIGFNPRCAVSEAILRASAPTPSNEVPQSVFDESVSTSELCGLALDEWNTTPGEWAKAAESRGLSAESCKLFLK